MGDSCGSAGGATPCEWERQLELQKRAIHLLRLSNTAYLGCREQEATALQEMMEWGARNGVGGSVFVFGLSGTGKTTTVNHVVKTIHSKYPRIHTVSMSGSSYDSTAGVIHAFFQEIKGVSRANKFMFPGNSRTRRCFNYRQALAALTDAFQASQKYNICVMDEVDYMQGFIGHDPTCRNSNWMLQAILAASSAPGSRVFFVAISNNLELATRITAKQCRMLLFKPYDEKQIIAIIKGKLAELDAPYTPVINDTAILLLARRVANTSGDLRACLDTFTRAISNSLSNLEDEIERLTATPVTDYASASETATPDRSLEDCETPKRCYSDMSQECIEVRNYQVGHKDIGTLTPTLSLTKIALLESKVKPLPLMQLLALLSICKSALDDGSTLLSYRRIKMALLHLGDMMLLNKVDVEDFCTSKFTDAIDIFKELGVISKPTDVVLEADDAPDGEFVLLTVDATTLAKIVLPISPAFVGLDLEFPLDEICSQSYSTISKSFNIKQAPKKPRRKLR
ncbi:CDC6-like ATPase [Babesia caballi]|uniref:CDC6-like ATPase n=1 Tax=Babesia caballi TaxID=5871 RepID=A0AAV4LW25_BABCB|nr:CDC6-like ATPase [Babesia caballi]